MIDLQLVIGIDIGTSGARAVAMGLDRRVAASGMAKLADFSDDHRAPEAWAAAVDTALGFVLAAVDPGRVRAIAIDGTSGTLLPVNEKGGPLARPMMYNDPVEDEAILSRIAALAPQDSAVHGSTSGLAKALWFQSRVSPHRILHQADWLAGRLMGRYEISDENNALKTGYDPIARRWPDWIAETGLDMGLLPQVVPAGAPLDHISNETAARFKLSPKTLVVAGTTDGCASFLATGADKPGDGVTALGTTMTIKLLSKRPLFAPEYGLYSHRIGDHWLAGGASNSGGIVLASHFSDARIAELSKSIDPTQPTGLDYYPLTKPGERFPINDPQLQPRMTPRPRDDARFLQAIFEGIAGIEKLAYARLQSLGSPALRNVRTVGGGAKNAAWSAIRARTLNVPFPAVASEDAAAGTARLALQGARIAEFL